MIGANKVITCFVEQKDETYKRYLITGATWRELTAVSTTDKGLTLDNFVKIRIPIENAPEGFTPQKEMLVMQECNENVGVDITASALKRKYNAVTIKSVTYNTDGQCPHWKLEGV